MSTKKRRNKEIKNFHKARKIVSESTIGEQLDLLEMVAVNILEWSMHEDFTREELVGKMVERIVLSKKV